MNEYTQAIELILVILYYPYNPVPDNL